MARRTYSPLPLTCSSIALRVTGSGLELEVDGDALHERGGPEPWRVGVDGLAGGRTDLPCDGVRCGVAFEVEFADDGVRESADPVFVVAEAGDAGRAAAEVLDALHADVDLDLGELASVA